MGMARLQTMVQALMYVHDKGRDQDRYPSYLPVDIVERAPMSDHVVTYLTLESIAHVSKNTTEHRPLGLFVSRWAVLLTCRVTDRTVLDRSSSEEVRFGIG